MKVKSLSRVRLFETPWTVVHQAPLSMGFSRQEYWSGLPFPSPGDLPDPGIEARSPALQANTLTSEPPGKSSDLHTIPFKLPSSRVKPQPLSKELTRTNQNVSGGHPDPPRSFPALLGQASSLSLFVLPLISLKIVPCDFYQPLSLSRSCIQDAHRLTTCAHLALVSCSVLVTRSWIFKKFPTLCVTADPGDG